MDMESVIIKLKDIYSSLINFIDASDDSEIEFEKLTQTFKKHKIIENVEEVRLIFQLLSEISNNHHRTTVFFDKIEKIFINLIKDPSLSISHFIPDYSNYNKRILFLLLKKKLLKPDKSFLNKYSCDVPQILYYLYPSVKESLDEQKRNQIEKEILDIYKEEISTFEEKCQIGENDSYICSLIRSDSIEEFVAYVNRTNLSFLSKIQRSIYETNSFLIDKEPTLIEYAAFFGSIQIIQYLKYNNVPLNSSLWLYSIHSKNAELIHFLEYNSVEPPNYKDKYIACLKESIKCHHNDIAEYITNNLIENDKNQFKIYEYTISTILHYHNYAYFPKYFELDNEFFYLCKFKYQKLVDFFLQKKEKILEENSKKHTINENFKVLIIYYRLLKGKNIDSSFLRTMEKIAVPPSVIILENSFFESCKALKQVAIPSSVTSIGFNAFSRCSSLTGIIIPSSVTSIRSCAFRGCSSLKHISIPSSVTSIGSDAFRECSSLKQISIPSSVTEIEISAFYDCKSLTQISIPSSVTLINYETFSGCSSLKQISIPSSVTLINNNAFYKCSSLAQITIPSSVESIRSCSFLGCSSLKQISIPSSVTLIGDYAFYKCSSLDQITIPSSVKSIGDNTFSECSSLTKITIPSSVELIGENTFSKCSSLTKITIPSSVTSIKKNAFKWCSSLAQISIPSSVKSIGDNAFDGCSSLKQISIPSSVTSFGENIFNKIKELEIIGDINYIPDNFFKSCHSLTQITIPLSVTSIGNSAFQDCSSLTQISIPSSVKLIGSNAFDGCSSLKQISIPSSVTSFGENIFNKIKELEIIGDINYIPDNFFKSCHSLTQITIPLSVTSIGNSAFQDCSSLTQISIPSYTKSIGLYTFYGCISLVHISIPLSVTSIGNSAFENCKSLTHISIPSSVTSIGNYAFSGCSSLAQIEIPSSVVSIGNNAFDGCTFLPQIQISSSNKSSFNESLKSSNNIDISTKLLENVSDEGLIENKMSNLLFSSFNDSKIWSPIDISCAIPNSTFYCAKINFNLSIFNVDDIYDNKEGYSYLIVRYTKDDISKYLDYLKFEYNSYIRMKKQVDKIITPIGYTQNISEEGFIFAFLTSTILTLDNSIDFIKELPLEKRFAYALKLIDTVNELFIEQKISGFHITPKTILINKQEEYIGLIGFIGEIGNLKLCSTANQFLCDVEFVNTPKIPKKCTPNSISDVYGLAKIVQLIVDDEIPISSYKNVISSALQMSPNDRLSLNEFKNKMHEIQKEVILLKNKNPTHPFKQHTRLADMIKKISIPIKTKEGYQQIFKLPSIVTRNDSKRNIRKVIIGPNINTFNEEIRILIVGSTGCGKTTFLNGIVNYLYGVQWTDDFRFKCDIEDDYEVKNYSECQTTDITTVYTLYWQPGFAVPYTVTLIDTPGFGQCVGIKRDKEIIYQIESLLKNENDCGIDSLNALAFTICSAICKLPSSNMYIFDSIMRMFGKDIVNNFIIISTFCDAGKPSVLDALNYREIPTNFVCKFNNSAIFAKRSGSDAKITELFWDIGQANYESLFTTASKMSPKSLILTKDALDLRMKTNALINSTYQNIRNGITKIANIEEICLIIEQYKKRIEENENFIKTVKFYKTSRIDLRKREKAINCRECRQTCLYPCNISEDNLKNCSVMDNSGYCKICGCYWIKHCKMEFKWELCEIDEKITLKEIIQQYGDMKSTQQDYVKIFENALNDYIKTWLKTAELVAKCKNYFNILNRIKLRPINLSEKYCIQLFIETEKQSLQPRWCYIVKWFEEILKQQKIIEESSVDKNDINKLQKEMIKAFLEEKIRCKIK